MNYAKLIRSTRHPMEIETKKPVTSDSDLIRLLMKELSERTEKIPTRLENTLLSDYEVNDMLTCALDFQKKYFSAIPLKKDLIKEFIYNIPKEVVMGIRHCNNHQTIPDILNPMMFVYPLLVANTFEAMGMYWKILLPMLDGNREVIEKDAAIYDNREENENE